MGAASTNTVTALDRVLGKLREIGPVTQKGKDWRCRCPAHNDETPSLDVNSKDGRVLFICRSAGCSFAQIIAALGMKAQECFDGEFDEKRDLKFEDRVVRYYDYRDEKGDLLFQSVRLGWPKDFRQRRWGMVGSHGRWFWNLEGVRIVPYRLPEILAAPQDEILVIAEGERDADNLVALGFHATTNPMGAGKWRHLEQTTVGRVFANRRVVILADNDPPGKAHAKQVAEGLEPIASRVVVIELPGLPPKGDVSDWLAQGHTADELRKIIATALDPVAQAAAEWGEPIPLDSPMVAGDCPEFPTEAFPKSVAEFAYRLAQATNVPIGYVGTFILGVTAGAIGATLKIRLTGGDEPWEEFCTLYTCVVAPKSSGKTPAFSAITRPVAREQARRSKEEGAETQPIFATDTTVEGLAPKLKNAPRGLLVAADELSGWVSSFNQYKAGKGADRQFWLSNWSGGSLSVLRRNPDAPHLYVPFTCVSVVGGIQPSVIGDLRTRDDGLIERVLFTCEDPLPRKAANRQGTSGAKEWQAVVGTLLAREMADGEYGPRPFVISLSDEAWEVFHDWTAELAEQMKGEDRDTNLDGVRSKMAAHAARLSLVCHALRCAAESRTIESELPADDMVFGVALARYYLAHAEKVLGFDRNDDRIPAAERILAWVERTKPTTFSRSELYGCLRRQFSRPEDLIGPLKLLVQLNYLRYADQPIPATGRRPSPRFEIHPQLAQKGVAHAS